MIPRGLRTAGPPALLATLAWAVAACAPPAQDARPTRPNVILISLDTFRADALRGTELYPGSETPHLAAFRRDAVLFPNAFAPVSHTLSSHLSMFTSLYPDVHGVQRPPTSLAPGIPTLTAILRDYGYSSHAVVSSDWLRAELGFGRHFGTFELVRAPTPGAFAERVNDRGLEILAQHGDGGPPLFLFLHYYDAHSDFGGELPYASPGAADFLSSRPTEHAFCDGGECATRYLLSFNRSEREPTADFVDTVESLYRLGVEELDTRLGRLFDSLRRAGLYEPALIVLTADHGEEFYEHGRFNHAQPYDETLRVPFLVKLPGAAGRGASVDTLVELVDVLPTLLDYLGLPIPAHAQGESLLPWLLDPATPAAAASEPADAVLLRDKLRSDRFALRTPRYKLIADLASQEIELYDLLADPGETASLAGSRPDVVRRLMAELRKQLRANAALAETLEAGSGPPGALDDEQRETLQALGYLTE